MKIYRVTFKVTGRFEFPLDMLRYDGCAPADSADAAAIAKSLSPDGDVEDITVTLSRWAEREWFPTVDRWHSFMWSVDLSSVTKDPL